MIPQTDVNILVVQAEAMFETSPTVAEITLLACPDNAGYQLELLAVGVVFHTLPVDATNNVAADLEWVDDSDSDTVANLKAAFNFDVDANAAMVARVYNEIWRGSQILDPGDTVNVEADITTPDTAGAGAAFIVEYRVKSRQAA